MSFTDDASNSETLTSAATATVGAGNTAATGAPTITGTAEVGETLTASTTGIADANGLTTPGYTYQWIRVNGTEADIAAENSITYTLVDADLGTTLKVRVSFTDDASNSETLTSAATATVGAGNTAATGAPTITGTAEVGETLTASTTGIADANGLTTPGYTYQWIRVNGTEADIAAENSITYTLVDADLGTTLKVRVSFTDDASNSETLTSAATATVGAGNTAATGAPTITGTAEVGETLTASTTGIADANGLTTPGYTYQWIRVNGTEADIAAENSSTYTLVDADLGTTLKVRVSFTDDASNSETLTSAATATVGAGNTAATGAPTITGTAEVGETLTASTTGIADANGLTTPGYTYQWIRVNGTEADIAAENSITYTLVDADLGTTLKVRVSFTDDASNSETLTSAATATVGAGNTAATGAPTITGTAEVGETLTASTTGIADANGLTTPGYTYQWIRVNGTEADIAAENSITYTLVDADLGTTLKVRVSFTDDASNSETLTSAATATVGAGNTAATGAPTITGTAEVGETLTASTTGIADANGLTTPGYTYQWIRVNGTEADIAGENSITYTLVDADLGTTLKVRVSFTDDASNSETLTSAATATVGAGNTAATGAPTITGTAEVGETLTASTTGIADANGLTTPGYTYQWIRVNGTEADIAGENSITYTLVDADLGTTLKVRVSFTDDASNSETLTSAATATVGAGNTAATGAPTITGTAEVGETLTASTTGIADANGLTTPGYTYQWIRVNGTEADIAGENSSTYTLVDADLGTTLKVRVSFTDDASNSETLTSAATATVGAGNTAPTGAPTITGTAEVGETLTASTTGIADANGLTTPGYTYQWIRVNGTEADIAGENSITYTLVDADLGTTLKVRVSFTDDASNSETLTSAATATVGAGNTAPTGAPTITGTAEVGETLTASTTGIADADGLTTPGPTRTSGSGWTARRPTLRPRIRAPTSWSPPTWARPSRCG